MLYLKVYPFLWGYIIYISGVLSNLISKYYISYDPRKVSTSAFTIIIFPFKWLQAVDKLASAFLVNSVWF
jgi:hypothetical protein